MKYILCLLLVISFNGCFSTSKTSDSYREVMKVINKYSSHLKKEGIVRRWYGLDYAGVDKIYDGKIHLISLGYGIDKNLHYQDARKLFYRIVNELLTELNGREEFREYFYHYPITYEDLHFSLSFDYENKGYLKKEDVDQIVIQHNEIAYYIAKFDGITNELVTKEIGPGIGTLSFTGQDSTRSIVRKLPEREEEAGL